MGAGAVSGAALRRRFTGTLDRAEERRLRFLEWQVTCAGQDAHYATGCSAEGRFVDNEDGTVTDNCTGFICQKDVL